MGLVGRRLTYWRDFGAAFLCYALLIAVGCTVLAIGIEVLKALAASLLRAL